MAKIRPAGSKKAVAGPKAPGAIGCLIVVAVGFVVLGLLLYYSIARG
jgi:hypothetical protein